MAPSGPDPAQPSSLRKPGSQDPAGPLTPQATQTVARTHGDSHRPLVEEVGMGERFAAASRPGPGQWAAVERALELCGTQPSACPWAPQLTRQAQSQKAWRARGRRTRSASHCTLCHEDHCEADCWQSGTSKRQANGHAKGCVPTPLSISLMSVCLVWVLTVLGELHLPFPSDEDKKTIIL